MKVLLDEALPHKLRTKIPNHDVSTVAYLGWIGMKNGELLLAAQNAEFEVFLTGDKNLSYQQNLKDRKLAVIVLSTVEWEIMKPNLLQIVLAIDAATPGSFQTIDCGEFRR